MPSLSVIAALCLTSIFSDAETPPKWDVANPPGARHEVPIDVREGTWINLDVSPDGKEIVFDLLGDVYTLPIEGGEARALVLGVAWQMQPKFSPDGKRIVFTSDQGGGDNIWVVDRDGSNARAVTNETFRLLNSPAWSPDGEWIAARKHFTGRRSLGAGEIWLYHVSGGEGLQLTTRANEQKDLGEPSFSPDGRYVYFSYDSTPGSSFDYSKDSTGQIYAIDRVDRTNGERVTTMSGPGGAVRSTPSHDGKQLAFVRRVRFQSTLFVLDLASGEARPVYAPLERDMQETWAIHGVYPSFAWLPDDSGIVFYARGKLRRVDLATGVASEIPFHVSDTRSLQPSLRFPIDVAPDEFHVKALRSVRVSPSGDAVVYQALGHLYRRALPDGTPERLTDDAQRFEFDPSFSRDGRSIVYVAWSDRDLAEIRVVDAAGGTSRAVTTQRGHYADPVFTPDGARIVYAKVGGGYLTSPAWSSEPGIYQIDVQGGTPRLITKKGSTPQFGAEATRVYLTSVASEKDVDRRTLWSIDLNGSEERTHVESEWATQFALSQDGKWIAYCERWNAYVAPFAATGRPVALGPKTKSLPIARASRDAGENLQFSADSSRLYWSLGPELFERALADSFAFLARETSTASEPRELPTPPASGRDISFRAPRAKPQGVVALVGARLITMQGERVIEDGVVVVRENRIAAIGARADVVLPAGARVIDASGTTIMPGLIDVHAHGPQSAGNVTPQANWSSCANLGFGVTTIHDPSHDTNAIFAASELQKAGLVLAPRTFSTGTIVYGAQGDFKAEIDSLDDARSHLRRLKAVGAFSVKSYNQPRRDQRQQVIEAARELSMMVVPEGGSLLQHNLSFVVDGHTGVEHSLPVERVYADVQALWSKSGVGYTPTLVVGYGGIWGENWWYQHDEVWKNERLQHFVPRFVLDPRSRRRPSAPEEDHNIRRSAGIVKSLLDVGAKAQLGAHGQLAGLGAHWELRMLGWSGISNHAALRCATLSGAEYVGLDRDLGSLEVGKLADLIVCEENPLDDLAHAETIRWTMLDGRLYDARTLAPADGRAGEAPRFFFEGREAGMPAQTTNAGCAGCAH